jgi:hypothetical protein
MTIIHTASMRTSYTGRPSRVPDHALHGSRDQLARSRRPAPMRPPGAPPRYRGTGVAMSAAPHGNRPVTLATTVGLALLAGIITLWLGMVAHLGQVANGEPAAASAAHVPDTLAVVRVEPGESIQDVAARVAPDAPAPQVVQRIRELNELGSPTLVAGQTLIAPVG